MEKWLSLWDNWPSDASPPVEAASPRAADDSGQHWAPHMGSALVRRTAEKQRRGNASIWQSSSQRPRQKERFEPQQPSYFPQTHRITPSPGRAWVTPWAHATCRYPPAGSTAEKANAPPCVPAESRVHCKLSSVYQGWALPVELRQRKKCFPRFGHPRHSHWPEVSKQQFSLSTNRLDRRSWGACFHGNLWGPQYNDFILFTVSEMKKMIMWNVYDPAFLSLLGCSPVGRYLGEMVFALHFQGHLLLLALPRK